jgi:ribosomal protein S16
MLDNKHALVETEHYSKHLQSSFCRRLTKPQTANAFLSRRFKRCCARPTTNNSLPTNTCTHTNRYWLAQGAQPSDRVTYLLSRAGLIPPPPAAPRFPKPAAAAAKDGAKKKK